MFSLCFTGSALYNLHACFYWRCRSHLVLYKKVLQVWGLRSGLLCGDVLACSKCFYLIQLTVEQLLTLPPLRPNKLSGSGAVNSSPPSILCFLWQPGLFSPVLVSSFYIRYRIRNSVNQHGYISSVIIVLLCDCRYWPVTSGLWRFRRIPCSVSAVGTDADL